MTWLVWTSTLLGIACVALAALRNAWTFPTAIVSVALLGIVVFDERLYSDALLQAFFVVANLYGWANWRRERARAGSVTVERMRPRDWAATLAAVVVASIGWGWAMHRFFAAAYPYWDAAIAMASVAAQILMARRKLENWVLWIAVDVASVPLYLAKQLWPFAGLYVIYLGLAIWGLVGWRRSLRRQGPVVA